MLRHGKKALGLNLTLCSCLVSTGTVLWLLPRVLASLKTRLRVRVIMSVKSVVPLTGDQSTVCPMTFDPSHRTLPPAMWQINSTEHHRLKQASNIESRTYDLK